MGTGRTEDLRQAVAEGDWPAVLRLWEKYAAGIAREIGRRECTPARLSEAREFLDWARRVALCARAQAQARLDVLHAARLYGEPPTCPPPLLRTSL